jgi:membrane protein required for colicin V production
MIWVDWVIIGIIALSGLIGLLRGLVREALSLIAWAAAIWVALSFSHYVAGLLVKQISAPSVRLIVAFAALFVITLILAALVNYLIAKLVDKTGLSGTDHMLGVFFGIARGVVLVAIIVLLAGATPLPKDPWWRQSVLIEDFQNMALWLRDFLPADIASKFDYDIEKKLLEPDEGAPVL